MKSLDELVSLIVRDLLPYNSTREAYRTLFGIKWGLIVYNLIILGFALLAIGILSIILREFITLTVGGTEGWIDMLKSIFELVTFTPVLLLLMSYIVSKSIESTHTNNKIRYKGSRNRYYGIRAISFFVGLGLFIIAIYYRTLITGQIDAPRTSSAVLLEILTIILLDLVYIGLLFSGFGFTGVSAVLKHRNRSNREDMKATYKERVKPDSESEKQSAVDEKMPQEN